MAVRWGCVGSGNIVKLFSEQLRYLPNSALNAIASASSAPDAEPTEKLRTTQHELVFTRSSSFRDLIADPDVNLIYVASASSAHFWHCKSALEAGKHVLCEKPLTTSQAEAVALFDEARKQGVLLAEGIICAYLPAMKVLRELLPSIGHIQRAELHQAMRPRYFKEGSILVNPRTAGGAFNALGSYTVFVANVIFGVHALEALTSDDVSVRCTQASPFGVELFADITLKFHDGATALLTHRGTDERLISTITGTKGTIQLNACNAPTKLWLNDKEVSVPALDAPNPDGLAPGLGVEARLISSLVESGAKEVPELPAETCIVIQQVMDLVRAKIPCYHAESSL